MSEPTTQTPPVVTGSDTPNGCREGGNCLRLDNGQWVQVSPAPDAAGMLLVDVGGPGLTPPSMSEIGSRMPKFAANYTKVLVLEPWMSQPMAEDCLIRLGQRIAMPGDEVPDGCVGDFAKATPPGLNETLDLLERELDLKLAGAYSFSYGAPRLEPVFPRLENGFLIAVAPAPALGTPLADVVTERASKARTRIEQRRKATCAEAHCTRTEIARPKAVQDGPELSAFEVAAALLGAQALSTEALDEVITALLAQQPLPQTQATYLRRLARAYTLRSGDGSALRAGLGFKADTCATYPGPAPAPGNLFEEVFTSIYTPCTTPSTPVSASAVAPRNTCLFLNRTDPVVSPPTRGPLANLASQRVLTYESALHEPPASDLLMGVRLTPTGDLLCQ